MTYKIVLIIAAYILELALFLTIPSRRKKLQALCGNKVMDIKNHQSTRVFVIYLFCLIIPAILLIRDFGKAIEFVDCGVAVLAFEMGTRELTLKGHYGVFENALVAGGTIVEYSDIMAFPVLELPEEEQANYDNTSLSIVCKKKGSMNVAFDSLEECKAVTAMVRELSGK